MIRIYKNRSSAIDSGELLTESTIPGPTGISMTIEKNDQFGFAGDRTISQMKRSHKELRSCLFCEAEFRTGCYLMTGSCVVPGNDFTLRVKM